MSFLFSNITEISYLCIRKQNKHICICKTINIENSTFACAGS